MTRKNASHGDFKMSIQEDSSYRGRNPWPQSLTDVPLARGCHPRLTTTVSHLRLQQ